MVFRVAWFRGISAGAQSGPEKWALKTMGTERLLPGSVEKKGKNEKRYQLCDP